MSIDAQTVERIIAFLSSSDQTNDESTRDLAQMYADATEEVNQRLSQCMLFLRSGHRSQAIRHAETEPRVRTQVEFLHLNGMIDVWQDAVANYGWARYQPIKNDVVELLNDAYQIENELRDVLQKYRELALAKTPLADRLLVLRQIATLDPTNPVWKSDIEMLEKGLMSQIASAGNSAMEQGDTNTVIKLIEQHDEQDWQLALEPTYRSFVEKALPMAYQKRILPRLVQRMNEHLANGDMDDIPHLRESYNDKFAAARTLNPDFEVSSRTRQLAEHVFSEYDKDVQQRVSREYTHDVNLMRSMLGGKHTSEQIDEALAVAQSHGLPIAPAILADVESCKAALKDNKILTNIVIVSLIGLVVVLAVLGFLMFEKLNTQ